MFLWTRRQRKSTNTKSEWLLVFKSKPGDLRWRPSQVCHQGQLPCHQIKVLDLSKGYQDGLTSYPIPRVNHRGILIPSLGVNQEILSQKLLVNPQPWNNLWATKLFQTRRRIGSKIYPTVLDSVSLVETRRTVTTRIHSTLILELLCSTWLDPREKTSYLILKLLSSITHSNTPREEIKIWVSYAKARRPSSVSTSLLTEVWPTRTTLS